MKTTLLKNVNEKLKNLPVSFLEDVDNYIDFLTFKTSQEENEIPNWHKTEVLKRIKANKTPVDAFEMLEDLDK